MPEVWGIGIVLEWFRIGILFLKPWWVKGSKKSGRPFYSV